jgi:tetratricopeptide (TPR) repeat protein
MFLIKRTRVLGVALSLALIGLTHAQDEFSLEDENWVATTDSGADPDLRKARELLASDKPAQARKILDTWIAAHQYQGHPELAEAFLLRGDAKLMAGDEYEALYDYEAIAKQFYGTPAFPRAIERESQIASKYINGLKRKWFGWLRLERAEALGEELLIRVQERMPGSQLAEQAALELADYYYAQRDLAMASDMYGIIIANYPDSKYRKYASLREIYSNIAGFKGPHYDRSPLVEARILIDEFQARFPADAEQAGITTQLEAWVDESEAAHILDTAMWYLKQSDEASTRFVLRRLIRDNPGSAAATKAVEMMTERGWLDEQTEPSATESPSPEGSEDETP